MSDVAGLDADPTIRLEIERAPPGVVTAARVPKKTVPEEIG